MADSKNEEVDLDTMEKARKMKENQGLHEIEVSFEGEADLRKMLTFCKKNPGHKEFINLKDFNIEHLPPEYQDSEIVDVVRARADRTVRLSVKGISKNRPEYFDDSKTMRFPFYKDRGRSGMMMTGTGYISSVTMYCEEYSEKFNKYCKCNECVRSDTPEKTWGKIWINTAAHVVSDDIEAANTTAHLFYDDGETDLNKVPRLSGFKHSSGNIEHDKCTMKYYTHDMDLLDKLGKMWVQCDALENKVIDKYSLLDKNKNQRYTGKTRDLNDALGKLSVCVSHPHGCSKSVSVGKVTDIQQTEFGFNRYFYDCCTCTGSSGSSIFILAYVRDDAMWPFGLYGKQHVHSGGEKTDQRNRNFSTYGFD